ncbi:protein EARLY FLOWERING 4-like [Syzygium oleosum]|uniref:protein EARLY FLOWERING 4-like n=1 Tax=Syzygium oleosum TaxID=219896 RepID=UPI0011D22A32|nr:protein EARLY FLOWERING 4-like [Syzygium oleosum]
MEESAAAKPRRTTTNANTDSTTTTTTTTVATADRPAPEPGGGEDAGPEGGGCDVEVWEMLSASFRQVQSALDRNRALISQVNENHQSKVPDNLAKNVALIREINGNVSKVLSIYSDLSVNFSGVVYQRRALQNGAGGRNGGKLESSGA